MEEDGTRMEGDESTGPALVRPGLGHNRPAVEIDYEEYLRFLEDDDISEADKRELLGLLWSIVCEFVAMGFGVHPVQQAQESCGKPEENTPKPAQSNGHGVNCEDGKFIKSIDRPAESENPPAGKGARI